MRVPRWQYLISAFLSIVVLIVAYLNRGEIVEAFSSLGEARPEWLLLAFALELLGFFCASQVYHRVLTSLGYHFGRLRLWGIALVAIMLSQSIPAGGVASYAFLIQTFRRRGVSAGHATLMASLEVLSYVCAMLLVFAFSLIYLMMRIGFKIAQSSLASLLAAGVALLLISLAVFVLTRERAVLLRWMLGIKDRVARLLRRCWSDEPITKLVDEIIWGREMIACRRSEVMVLVLIQLASLATHSLAMLVVLYSLGVSTSFFVVLAAFGIALITSTFNVLPGGGGTVEAMLVLTLSRLGVGPQAYVAAVIFRMLNFWLLAPIAIVCYRWLMTHAPKPPQSPSTTDSSDVPVPEAVDAPHKLPPIRNSLDTKPS